MRDELEEIDRLLSASTPLEAWRELVFHDSYRRPATSEVQAVLTRLHGDGTADGLQTVLLMLTSWRWERCSADLIREIVASCVLTADELDQLADQALRADKVYAVLPTAWFLGPTVVIARASGETWDNEPAEDPLPAEPRPGDLIKLELSGHRIRPPVRRWAAGHLVRSDPRNVRRVERQLPKLDPRNAAAVMVGLLDELRSMSDEDALRVLTAGVSWPHKSVRKPALTELAARGDLAEVRRRGQTDPDASIRTFAAALSANDPAAPTTLF